MLILKKEISCLTKKSTHKKKKIKYCFTRLELKKSLDYCMYMCILHLYICVYIRPKCRCSQWVQCNEDQPCLTGTCLGRKSDPFFSRWPIYLARLMHASVLSHRFVNWQCRSFYSLCVCVVICLIFGEVYFSKEVPSCPKQKLAMKEFSLKCRVDRQKAS